MRQAPPTHPHLPSSASSSLCSLFLSRGGSCLSLSPPLLFCFSPSLPLPLFFHNPLNKLYAQAVSAWHICPSPVTVSHSLQLCHSLRSPTRARPHLGPAFLGLGPAAPHSPSLVLREPLGSPITALLGTPAVFHTHSPQVLL